MFAFTAEVGSKSDEALNLLASWAATENQPIVRGDERPLLKRGAIASGARRVGAAGELTGRVGVCGDD
jgi:hypothetical protein